MYAPCPPLTVIPAKAGIKHFCTFNLPRRSYRQQGFTLIVALIATAVIGLGLATTGEVWSKSKQRELELDLLFTGNQFRQAIGDYYERSPGGAKQYPQNLEDLLQDRRYATTQRYLRRIYRDPMSGKADWGIIPAPGGGIMGVYSQSKEAPVKSAGFSSVNTGFDNAPTYAQWQFAYSPSAPAPAATTTPITSVPPSPPPKP